MMHDEDGSYQPTPAPVSVTMLGLDAGHIVDQISEKLLARWSAFVQKEIREKISQQVQTEINDATAYAIKQAVEEVIADGFQQTDTWGAPKGPKRSLADVIREALLRPDRDYSRDTVVGRLVSEAVKSALSGELKVEMEAARKQFREQVDAVLNAKLQESLRASLGLS